MTPEEELLEEIKKINRRLSVIDNPLKNASYSFISGIFRSLGSLFGTVIVTGVLFYLFSQLNLTKTITDFVQSVMENINWAKIVPTPSVDPFSFKQLMQSLPPVQ